MIIRIVMVLMLMAGWVTKILDVKGSFLHGEFYEGRKAVYIASPGVFEGIYGSELVLMLIKTIYGLKHKTKSLWR